MAMTWKEFKEWMEEEGVKEEDEIWYFDTWYPEDGTLYFARGDDGEGFEGIYVSDK